MKLYDFAFSPNSMKVRAVAYELGIPLEHVHVDLLKGTQQQPAFLAINPNGRVPVLEDEDFVLSESVAIINYLAGKKGGALVPQDARTRADVGRWLSWQLAHLGPAMSKVAFERVVKKFTNQGPPDEARIAEGTAEWKKLTGIFNRALDKREFITGSLSVADFALAAHYGLAEPSGLDLAPYPNVKSWLGRMLARDSFKRALDDGRASMKAYAA